MPRTPSSSISESMTRTPSHSLLTPLSRGKFATAFASHRKSAREGTNENLFDSYQPKLSSLHHSGDPSDRKTPVLKVASEKSSGMQTAPPQSTTLLLPVRQQGSPITLRFTASNQTLFLRLKNEGQIPLKVSLLSLPTFLGFSTREVLWNVPALGDELAQVTWKGKSGCKDVMVLKVGMTQVRIALEAFLENDLALRSPLAPIRSSEIQSPSAFRTPVATNRRETHIPSSAYSNYSTMTGVPAINSLSTAKKMKRFQIETKLIRPEQPTSRLEALQMELLKKRVEQKQWIIALPIEINDLQDEIQRLKVEYSQTSQQPISSKIPSQRSISHNTKLRLLKQWVQLVIAHFGVDISRLEIGDDQLLYTILVNAYRTHPKPLNEILRPADFERLTRNDLNDSLLDDSDDEGGRAQYDADTWFSRFQLLINLEEYESPPEEDKASIVKLSKLCQKLVEKRRNVHLMNVLLFVQSNVRRTIVIAERERQERAALKIQNAFKATCVRRYYLDCIRKVRCTQSSLRCIIAQQESEMNRKRRHIVRLQSLARAAQAQENLQFELHSIRKAQNQISSFAAQIAMAMKCQSVGLTQSLCRRNLVNPIEADCQRIVFVQSLIRLHESQKSTLYQRSATMWMQQNIRRSICEEQSTQMLRDVLQVQSCLRRMQVNPIEKCVHSVTRAQAHLRSHLAMNSHMWLASKVNCAQNAIRTIAPRHELEHSIQNVVRLQSADRSLQTQSFYQSQIKSLVLIQSAIRRSQCQQSVLSSFVFPIKLTQSVLRTWDTFFQHRFTCLSIVDVQSKIRAGIQLSIRARQMAAVRTIQSTSRMQITKNRYLKLRKVILNTQTKLRSAYAQRVAISDIYHVTKVQSMLRMWQTQPVEQRVFSVVQLQSIIRTGSQLFLAHQQLSSVTLLQSSIRQEKILGDYHKRTSTVALAQKAIKRTYYESRIHQAFGHIKSLQSTIRCMTSVGNFTRQIQAVNLVQKRIRQCLVGESTFSQFQRVKDVQSMLRMHSTNPFPTQRGLIVFAQSCLRTSLFANEFSTIRRIIVTTESLLRTKFIRCTTLEAEKRVRNYQRAVRMTLEPSVESQVASVKQVQSIARSIEMHSNFINARVAVFDAQRILRTSFHWINQQKTIMLVSLVQRNFRKQIVTPAARDVASVVHVQSNIRGAFLSNLFAKKQRAATKIQASWKAFLSSCLRNYCLYKITEVQSIMRRNQQIPVESQVLSVQRVQSKIRQLQLSSQTLHSIRSVTRLQSIVRTCASSQHLQKELQSTLQLQCALRTLAPQLSAAEAIRRVVMSQGIIRSFCTQSHFNAQLSNIVDLQSVLKALHAMETLQKNFTSITLTQTILNRSLVLEGYKMQVKNISLTQSHLRSSLQLSDVTNMRMHIISVQSKLRALSEIHRYSQARHLTQFVQSGMRSLETQHKFMSGMSSVTSLQSVIRRNECSIIAQKEREAIIATQTVIRTNGHVSDFNTALKSLISCQSVIFSFQEQRRYHDQLKGITLTQNVLLGEFHSSAFEKETQIINIVQNAIRCQLSMQTAEHLKKNITFLQRALQDRMDAARDSEKILETRSHISSVQNCMRRFSTLMNFERVVDSVVAYQQYARMRSSFNKFLKNKKSVTLIQSHARSLIAVAQFKEDVSEHGRQRRAATTIQRVFRGYVSRNLRFSKQQSLLRQRLERVKQEFEERRRIQRKTLKGLHILLTSKQMSNVMKACADLDNATTVSEKSCNSMCHEGALLQLMHLIKTCNRSEPHVKLLVHMLNILINVSKNVYRAEYVFNTKDCVDILVEQLQMYRDKPEIFLRAMKILEQLAISNSDNENSLQAQRMQKIREMKGTVKRIHAVAAILEGKYKLEKKFEESQRVQITRHSGDSAVGSRGKQSPVVLCYESLISFIKHLDGKILSDDKPSEELTMEDRQLSMNVQRASIRPSQALQLLTGNDFVQPTDRRSSLAPSKRRMSLAPGNDRRSSIRPSAVSGNESSSSGVVNPKSQNPHRPVSTDRRLSMLPKNGNTSVNGGRSVSRPSFTPSNQPTPNKHRR